MDTRRRIAVLTEAAKSVREATGGNPSTLGAKQNEPIEAYRTRIAAALQKYGSNESRDRVLEDRGLEVLTYGAWVAEQRNANPPTRKAFWDVVSSRLAQLEQHLSGVRHLAPELFGSRRGPALRIWLPAELAPANLGDLKEFSTTWGALIERTGRDLGVENPGGQELVLGTGSPLELLLGLDAVHLTLLMTIVTGALNAAKAYFDYKKSVLELKNNPAAKALSPEASIIPSQKDEEARFVQEHTIETVKKLTDAVGNETLNIVRQSSLRIVDLHKAGARVEVLARENSPLPEPLAEATRAMEDARNAFLIAAKEVKQLQASNDDGGNLKQ